MSGKVVLFWGVFDPKIQDNYICSQELYSQVKSVNPTSLVRRMDTLIPRGFITLLGTRLYMEREDTLT